MEHLPIAIRIADETRRAQRDDSQGLRRTGRRVENGAHVDLAQCHFPSIGQNDLKRADAKANVLLAELGVADYLGTDSGLSFCLPGRFGLGRPEMVEGRSSSSSMPNNANIASIRS